MRLQWWPATVLDPHTAVTFECLRHFEKVNVFGHINATDFYRALAHMSDPWNLIKVPVSRILISRDRELTTLPRIENDSLCW
jgi:hypothetical protein